MKMDKRKIDVFFWKNLKLVIFWKSGKLENCKSVKLESCQSGKVENFLLFHF